MSALKEQKSGLPIAKLEGLPYEKDLEALKHLYAKLITAEGKKKKKDLQSESPLKKIPRYSCELLGKIKSLLFNILTNDDAPKAEQRAALRQLIRAFKTKYGRGEQGIPEAWLRTALEAVLKICEEPLRLVHVISTYNFSPATRRAELAAQKATLRAIAAYRRNSFREVVPSQYVYTSYTASQRLQISASRATPKSEAEIEAEMLSEQKRTFSEYHTCTQEFISQEDPDFLGTKDISDFLCWSGANSFMPKKFPMNLKTVRERLQSAVASSHSLQAINKGVESLGQKFRRRKCEWQRTPSPESLDKPMDDAIKAVCMEETLNASGHFVSILPREQAKNGKTLLKKIFPKRKRKKSGKFSHKKESKRSEHLSLESPAMQDLEAQDSIESPQKVLLAVAHIGKMEDMYRAQAALLDLPRDEFISVNVVPPQAAPTLEIESTPPHPQPVLLSPAFRAALDPINIPTTPPKLHAPKPRRAAPYGAGAILGRLISASIKQHGGPPEFQSAVRDDAPVSQRAKSEINLSVHTTETPPATMIHAASEYQVNEGFRTPKRKRVRGAYTPSPHGMIEPIDSEPEGSPAKIPAQSPFGSAPSPSLSYSRQGHGSMPDLFSSPFRKLKLGEISPAKPAQSPTIGSAPSPSLSYPRQGQGHGSMPDLFSSPFRKLKLGEISPAKPAQSPTTRFFPTRSYGGLFEPTPVNHLHSAASTPAKTTTFSPRVSPDAEEFG